MDHQEEMEAQNREGPLPWYWHRKSGNYDAQVGSSSQGAAQSKHNWIPGEGITDEHAGLSTSL